VENVIIVNKTKGRPDDPSWTSIPGDPLNRVKRKLTIDTNIKSRCNPADVERTRPKGLI
jgi:hypothetical protein